MVCDEIEDRFLVGVFGGENLENGKFIDFASMIPSTWPMLTPVIEMVG